MNTIEKLNQELKFISKKHGRGNWWLILSMIVFMNILIYALGQFMLDADKDPEMVFKLRAFIQTIPNVLIVIMGIPFLLIPPLNVSKNNEMVLFKDAIPFILEPIKKKQELDEYSFSILCDQYFQKQKMQAMCNATILTSSKEESVKSSIERKNVESAYDNNSIKISIRNAINDRIRMQQ